MNAKIYLDDDAAEGKLAKMLAKLGHHVRTPVQVFMHGKSDPLHLAYAAANGLVMLTKNHDDFDDLHQLVLATGGSHPGILVVRADNDRTRDMKAAAIVAAITKLLGSGLPLVNGLFILNQWR